MNNFILKSLLFFSILTVIIIALSFIPPNTNDNGYMVGMLQKHERLVSLKSPRIILAAGSNMAFGIDSKQIEDEFSIPVVNLAIHAGLGTSFILAELENSIDSGDIVFLSLEYFLGEGDYRLMKLASEYFPPASNYYSISTSDKIGLKIEDTKKNLKNIAKQLFNPKLKKNQENPIYSKNAFNKYGDLMLHLNKKRKNNLFGRGQMKYRYWNELEEINQFFEFAQKKNVTVFYLFPSYAKSEFERNFKVIEQLKDDLHTKLKVEIINEPSSFAYPDSLFFDTVYHLNQEGRKKRTLKLIDLIKSNPKVIDVLKSKIN